MSTTIAGVARPSELPAVAIRQNSTPIKESLLVWAILAVTALVYAPVLGFGFVYDDNGQIVDNMTVRSWHYVPQYFTSHVWEYLYPNAPGNDYRPMNLLWFRLNDALFGLRPEGWHLATLLLHVLATYLAYVLARKISGRPLVAAATAMVFGVHPMRHGVVAWISGSTESLCAVFFLAAFLAYLRSREGQRIRWISVSIALYVLALLSKETAIMLPALVLMHALVYGATQTHAPAPNAVDSSDGRETATQNTATAFQIALAYVPFAMLYVLARIHALHGFEHDQLPISWKVLALTAPSLAWFYVKQWLFPIHLSEFYGLQEQYRVDFWHVVFPTLALVALAALLWWSRKKLGPREVTFATLWIIIPLLPAFDVRIFQTGDLVHDRYFYLPSFGAALLLGLLLEKLARGTFIFGVPQKWLLAALVLLVPLSYGTANASSYWIDDYMLFQRAYYSAPDNPIVRTNYAMELAHRGLFFQAMPIMQQLLREQPNNWLANYDYGRLRYEFHDMKQAEAYFTKAIQIDPTESDGYVQLGLVDLNNGRLDLAEANIRRAVNLRPLEPNFHFALGQVLLERGRCAEARSEFSAALALKPDFLLATKQSAACKDAAAPLPRKSRSRRQV